jgi:threonine aldolase
MRRIGRSSLIKYLKLFSTTEATDAMATRLLDCYLNRIIYCCQTPTGTEGVRPMPQKIRDFRSDTVTRPTPSMKAAMLAAEVGDDVFGEDPTINALEAKIAQMLGKEAAVFVPSGTMSNLLGVRVHCQPGDEIICEAASHLVLYEQAGYAQLFGVAACPVTTPDFILRVEHLEGLVRGDRQHEPRTRLLHLENTHNRGSGRINPLENFSRLCHWARANKLKIHLDGARLFNAAVATGVPAATWAGLVDTVNVCFSKGLGAPVGSALVGDAATVAQARRVRKVLGGGMRQGGIIAAAAIYALENHIERLAEDHAKAQRLANMIRSIDGLRLMPEQVDTNIVFFDVSGRFATAAEFVERLKQHGVLMLALSKTQVRAVTHLDVNDEDVEAAGEAIAEICRA